MNDIMDYELEWCIPFTMTMIFAYNQIHVEKFSKDGIDLSIYLFIVQEAISAMHPETNVSFKTFHNIINYS